MIPVLLIFVVLAPAIAHMFLNLQTARAEAHRDTFSKSRTAFLLPDSIMDSHINDEMDSQFGSIDPTTRQHVFASSVEIPSAPNNLFDAPEPLEIDLKVTSIELFPEGFPNSIAEGWEYIPHKWSLLGGGTQHMMTYGTVPRSAWTYLGWPWVPTQDLVFEPYQMQSWHGGLSGVNEDMRERYKLAE